MVAYYYQPSDWKPGDTPRPGVVCLHILGGDGELTRMIAAEAATYAFTGCIVGCAAGLPLSRLLYNRLITTNFPYYTWSIPVPALLIILLFVIGATITSVHAPAKRIRGMSITDTINEL